jgi:hypothetical protein
VAGFFMRDRMAGMGAALLWIGVIIAWPVLFGVAIAFAGIVRESKQFSVRDLLIFITVVAILLGITVYALKLVRQ